MPDRRWGDASPILPLDPPLQLINFIGEMIGSSGESKNCERGGRKTIYQPVLIFRKCTRSIGLLHGKRGFFEKKMSQQGLLVAPPPPLESVTDWENSVDLLLGL